MNFNTYATKKTVTQAAFNVALFTANAGQLKYALTTEDYDFKVLMIVLIALSMIIQVTWPVCQVFIIRPLPEIPSNA